jgi:hypothetical protein
MNLKFLNPFNRAKTVVTPERELTEQTFDLDFNQLIPKLQSMSSKAQATFLYRFIWASNDQSLLQAIKDYAEKRLNVLSKNTASRQAPYID